MSFYIIKYVSKELSRRGGDLGEHLYFHSRPLRKAEHVSSVYFYNPGLDALCVHDHDFLQDGHGAGCALVLPVSVGRGGGGK